MIVFRVFQWFFLFFGLIAGYLTFANWHSDRYPEQFAYSAFGALCWCFLAIGIFMFGRGTSKGITAIALLILAVAAFSLALANAPLH